MVIAPRLPLPPFETVTDCLGGDDEDPETPENESDVRESTIRGGSLTAKLAVNVALPPFALRTVTVAVWLPAGTFAGFAPTLMVVPETVASSHPDADEPYAMFAMVIA
ncbi:MAG TPA: hypothetical protein VFZ21_25730, partial [Gemmatimonadaceae bacterium]|nr:hypothetical protein [Gemmatimonadaceae bacterium]